MKTLARERDTAEVLGRLRSLRQDSVARWGRMSVHQMVCHLSDGYRLLTGELTSPPVATPLPRPMMKWIALYAPVRWPAGIPTTPELDQSGGGTRPADFAADVAELKPCSRRSQLSGAAASPGLTIPFSAGCPSRPGCDGRTCTPTTISVSSACSRENTGSHRETEKRRRKRRRRFDSSSGAAGRLARKDRIVKMSTIE